MRRVVLAALVAPVACGGGHAAPDAIDGPPPECQPAGATGQVFRDANNPHLLAGSAFSDGQIDISISDPDLRFDATSGQFQLYYATAHAPTFADPSTQMIRHATSGDAKAWSVKDVPALVAAEGSDAWDHVNTETPTVVFDENAAPDRRYVMMYSGANGPFQTGAFPDYAIGLAFSADGETFTRLPASESPHGQDGLVLTGADVYPIAGGAIVADPELALVDHTYHLWFSSFSCDGGGSACAPTAFGIAHATSTDAVHWVVQEAPVKSLLRAAADPTSGGGQPSVVYDEATCRYEMWLTSDAAGDHDDQPVVFNNSAGFWHATSLDGESWSVSFTGQRDLEWNAAAPAKGEQLGLLTGADVAQKGNGRFLVYVGFDNNAADVPDGFALPDRSQQGFEPGVMALDLATRDAN